MICLYYVSRPKDLYTINAYTLLQLLYNRVCIGGDYIRTKQDVDILVALIGANEPITSYQIAKDTGISLPQVRYRLPKLIQSEIVNLVDQDGRELYEAHSVLSSRSTIDAITEHLVSISDIIDRYELSSPVCVKSIISFIVDRTVID